MPLVVEERIGVVVGDCCLLLKKEMRRFEDTVHTWTETATGCPRLLARFTTSTQKNGTTL